MKHFKLLLFLSLVLCIQLTLAAKKQKCPPNMALVKCSSQYQGVCAFFKGKGHHLKQKSSANGCIACMDKRVKYYVDGQCGGDKVYCDDNIRPEFCTKEYFPVCGYNSKCKGDNCGISAGNRCMACANADIDWYVVGECPNNSNEVTCDPDNRPEICTLIYDPVCATVQTCKGKQCTVSTQTFGSGCSACGNPDVISYVPGECPPVATQCDPDNRPEVCTADYSPVCATVQICSGDSCSEISQTYGNACSACGDENVISYVPGACSIQCDPNNRPEVCTFIYQPVCATVEDCNYDGCTTTYQTSGNSCTACADPNVVSYVDGECAV